MNDTPQPKTKPDLDPRDATIAELRGVIKVYGILLPIFVSLAGTLLWRELFR